MSDSMKSSKWPSEWNIRAAASSGSSEDVTADRITPYYVLVENTQRSRTCTRMLLGMASAANDWFGDRQEFKLKLFGLIIGCWGEKMPSLLLLFAYNRQKREIKISRKFDAVRYDCCMNRKLIIHEHLWVCLPCYCLHYWSWSCCSRNPRFPAPVACGSLTRQEMIIIE